MYIVMKTQKTNHTPNTSQVARLTNAGAWFASGCDAETESSAAELNSEAEYRSRITAALRSAKNSAVGQCARTALTSRMTHILQMTQKVDLSNNLLFNISFLFDYM